MKGKNYDYKEAYNKNLTAKARLHYLENARNDQDSPNNMCSPAHYGDSPVKQVGIVDPNTGMPIAPAQPSNTLGAAQPVFKPQAQQAAQGIYGQQQVPGTFDRSLDPMAAAPLMKKCKY